MTSLLQIFFKYNVHHSICFDIFIYLCDFAKRCPLSFRVLLDVSREPRPEPIRGWVDSLFCVKTRGGGRGGGGDFFTSIRVLCQKVVQSQRIFPVA